MRPPPVLRWLGAGADDEVSQRVEVAEESRVGSEGPPTVSSQRTFLCVDGAGEELVNGVYVPVEALPPDAGWAPGPLIWRHSEQDWLHVTFGSGCWWIGHYRYGVRDFYVTTGGRSDVAPVGDAVTWGWTGAGGHQCIDSRGERPFPVLNLVPPWVPIDLEIIQEHLMRPQRSPAAAGRTPTAGRTPSAAAPRKRWWDAAEEIESLRLEAFLRFCKSSADSETDANDCGVVARGVFTSPWLGWNSKLLDTISSSPLYVYPAEHSEHNAFSQMKAHFGRAPFSPELWSMLAEAPSRWQARGLCKTDLVAEELARLVGTDFADAVGQGSLRLASASLWAGARGTRTPLHRDYVPAVVLQVAGSKRFFLSTPKQVRVAASRGLLPAATWDVGNTDSFCVDGTQESIYGLSHAAPARVSGTVALLREGDCLVLPANIYHDVECASEDPVSLSLTLRFEIPSQ